MPHPKLFPSEFFEANPLLIQGSLEYLQLKLYAFQDQLIQLIAAREYTLYRARSIVAHGGQCDYVDEPMIDLTYRESDISVIPIPVEDRVEHLVRDRLVDLPPSPVVVSATCATVASEALLCDKYGTRCSVFLVFDGAGWLPESE